MATLVSRLLPKPKDPAPAGKARTLRPADSVIGTILIYFFAQLVASFVIVFFAAARGWDTNRIQRWLDTSVAAQFSLILMVEALTIFLVWQYLRWRQTKPAAIGFIKPQAMDIVRALAGFAVYFPVYVALYALAQKLLPQINYEQKQQIGFETAAGTTQMILVFVSLVILPPLAEEILTRGFLFTGLRRKFKWLIAALMTSLLFAAAHLQFGSGAPLLWTAAMDTFILSMVLCYLREKTGSLWPGIFLHAIKNGLAFAIIFSTR